MSRRQGGTISALAEHPNLGEILGILAQLAHIRDDQLPVLAEAWSNSIAGSQARDRALSPDSPLILEVLGAFEAVADLFDDDLRGEAAYLTVPGDVAITALKAVRDAIAAAYAKPVLTQRQYATLLEPWLSVFPAATVAEPDLGPRAEHVKKLLASLPALTTRCHDETSRRLYEGLVDASFAGEGDRADARETAFQAAVLTNRRHTWALIRRSGAEGLSRRCGTCRPPETPSREDERVMALCLDAACALLVADAISDDTTNLLTAPVSSLIPQQRGASS